MNRKKQVRIMYLVVALASALAIHPIIAQVQPPTNLRLGSTSSQNEETFTTSISQFGITWTFADSVVFGQYVNGDYWVISPVEIVSIDPPSALSAGRTSNGSMINPDPNVSAQGFDSSTRYASYDATLNVARPGGADLSPSNSLILTAGESLVSTISNLTAGTRPQLDDAAILTAIGEAPASGSFRPPYVGSDKTSAYMFDQVDTSKLQSLPRVGSTPAIVDVAGNFERPWIDFRAGWTARYLHPANNMPDYGRDMASTVGIGAMMLLLDFTLAEKQILLTRYLQLGLDLWGILQNGGDENWTPNGGHASGRKWPVLFAGILFDDTQMQSIGSGDGSGFAYFGEDSQTFYVDQSDIDLTNSGSWNPDSRTPNSQPYNGSMIGMPEWGIRHSTTPAADDASWNAYYRECCTANAWAGFVLAARIMGAKTLWAHDALFDYQDRYMQVMNGEDDGYTVNGEPGSPDGFRSWTAFEADLWDLYRSQY